MDSTDAHTRSSLPISLLKACRSCARAKAKCVAGGESNRKCQRCHRLQKVCEPAVAQARSQPRKRRLAASRGPKSQVDKLEEKLDGLVTLLTSTRNVSPSMGTTPSLNSLPGLPPNDEAPPRSCTGILNPHLTPSKLPQPTQESQNDGQWPSQGTASQQLEPPIAPQTAQVAYQAGPSWTGQGWYTYRLGYPVNGPCFSAPKLNASGPPNLTGSFVPTWEDANVLLDRFRNELSPWFPFVLIPRSKTAEELNRERPFLYICVLAVSSRNPSQQSDLGKMVMRQLAEKIFVNGERTLELLLGVLTYAGWCYYIFWNVPQLTSLLSAAMTLIWDLGLGKPLPTAPPTRTPLEEAIKESSMMRYLTMISKGRTLEERRAFLGCLFLSSHVFVFFRRNAAIPWSPYADECLLSLRESLESPNDMSALALVRLQMIVQKIHQSPWHDQSDSSGISAATLFIMNSLQEQLKQFYKDLVPEVRDNVMFRMHYHSAEILLYEIGLSKEPAQLSNNGPRFQRLEALYACLQACKSFFDAFFSVPVMDYFSFSMAIWSHITNGMIILQMLSIFSHPDWNLDYVRDTLDFDGVLDRLVEHLGQVEGEAVPGEAFIFSKMSTKIGCIRKYIDGRKGIQSMREHHCSNSFCTPQQDTQDSEINKTGVTGVVEFTDLLDEDWLKDFLMPFDYQANANSMV